MIAKSLGHYELIASLGAGGMGEVYRARDTRLGREVALKLLPATVAADPGRVARLEQEARTVASLRHPGIVTLFSLEEADGVRFLTMELVEGRTLADVLAGGTPGPAEACRLALPLVDALAYAHARGVIHRDLKPSNVMVSDDGRVLLLDFGIARMLDTGDGDEGMATRFATDPGVRVGTPRYMSPEQIRGGTLDARSDVFSLGLLLHELITGQHPFEAGNDGDLLTGILRDTPPPCGDASDATGGALTDLVLRCLAKEPAERFPDAGAVREALARIAGGAAAGPAPAGGASPGLLAAREALARQDWEAAYRGLAEADEAGSLAGEDLERLAVAGFWTSRFEEFHRAVERSFAAFVDEGNDEAAGLAALQLVSNHEHMGNRVIVEGWLRRAERLLVPGTRGYGYYLRTLVRRAIESQGDLEVALGRTDEMLALAGTFTDPELEALALLDRGRVLVQLGEVDEGLGLIDEAMALATARDLDPDLVGRIYCSMMASCQMLADYRRADEWSQAALTWCGEDGTGAYPGICRIHRADVLRRAGRWDEAMDLARDAFDRIGESMQDVAAGARYEIGEVHLSRGELAEAEAAFREAHERGREPLPGLARLRRAEGKPEAAASLLRRGLEGRELPLDRAPLLFDWCGVCLDLDRGDEAEAAAEELAATAARFGSATYAAFAEHALGRVRLAAGKPEEAIPHLRKAGRAFRELELPEDGARARLDLGRAYRLAGDEENAALEFGAARSTFEKLGAAPALREAEALLGGA